MKRSAGLWAIRLGAMCALVGVAAAGLEAARIQVEGGGPHASDHSAGGADAVTATDLASACTDAQVLGGTSGGTGVECQSEAAEADTLATVTGRGATTSTQVGLNGGITFDQTTDAIGAHTAAGTYDMNANILTNIGNTGTDFVGTTGALNLAGTLTLAANAGLTMSSGTGQYSQTFTGTATDAMTITAASLTTGSAVVLTGPSGGTAGVTDASLKITSDVGNNGPGGTNTGLVYSKATVDTQQDAYRGMNLYLETVNSNALFGNIVYGFYNKLTDAVALGNTDYGSYTDLQVTGDVNGTKTANGLFITVANTNTSDNGTRNTYAGSFDANGDTQGTSTTYAVYADAAGGDTNYALYTAAGSSLFTLGAGEYVKIDGSTTANTTTAGVLDLNVTSATNNNVAADINTTFTATGAATSYGLKNAWASSAEVVGGSIVQTAAGTYTTAAKTGADAVTLVDVPPSYTLYGTYSTASNTGATDDSAVRGTYGGYFTGTGATGGTATAYGIYSEAFNADTNYGIYGKAAGSNTNYGVFAGVNAASGATAYALYADAKTGTGLGTEYAGIFVDGNVGIGDTSPAALLTVGNGDLFQVDASGNISTSGTLAFSSSTNNLSAFAATTSAQLAGVLSDETGTGLAVFATTPTLTTPIIGAATGTSLAVTGAITSSGGGVGYASGAGGAVTQSTSKSTGVTINKLTGVITMNNAALAAAAEATFVVTNSTVAATDVPVVAIASVGTAGSYLISVSAVAAGSFSITISNVSGGSLSQAVVINFAIMKGVSS